MNKLLLKVLGGLGVAVGAGLLCTGFKKNPENDRLLDDGTTEQVIETEGEEVLTEE